MTVFTYHPAPFGAVMHRLDCAAADTAAEGRRLAAVMRDVPPGQRAVLCNDLGGGRSPDERHLWTAKDAEGRLVPLTLEQAEQVYSTVAGTRHRAWSCVEEWMRTCASAYTANGGPLLDFFACNIETIPGADMRHEGTWDDVARWLVQDTLTKDYLQQWAGTTAAYTINLILNILPATTRVNLGACNFHGPRRDANGQLFGDSAPCGVSAPFGYMTETHPAAGPITPSGVLAHNLNMWDAVKGPKVCVIPNPCWGGETEYDQPKGPVPGCRSTTYTFSDGTRKRFHLKTLKTWANEYEAFVRYVAKDAVAIVCWWNSPPHGPAPSAAELAAMARVLGEVSQ
jgi:hypothetical protein